MHELLAAFETIKSIGILVGIAGLVGIAIFIINIRRSKKKE